MACDINKLMNILDYILESILEYILQVHFEPTL